MGISTPLEFAVQKGHLEMTQLLLRAGAKLTGHALNRAAMYGYLPVLKLLLKNKARKEIPFSPAIVPVVTFLEGVPKKRQLQVLDLILKAGANVNGEGAHGDTGLRNAIKLADVKLLRWLLNRGANPNHITKYGSTALHYAAFLGRCDCLVALIEVGARLDLKNAEGHTPLQWASFHNTKDAVKLLKPMEQKIVRGCVPNKISAD